MKHVSEITGLIKILSQSERFHVLCIMGAAGWAKTHTTRKVLGELGLPYQLLGAYSTPLALFNKLHEVGDRILVLDDTAGIFHNPQALSLLNAASWSSAGADGTRRVIWTSTTEKAAVDAFDFRGKLIVLTNYMPAVPQAKAFINRAMHYEINLNSVLVRELLLQAATSSAHFPNTVLAQEVAMFLSQHICNDRPETISLRTLELGYDFANHSPEGWRDLLVSVLPKRDMVACSSVEQLVMQLGETGLKTETQATRFSEATGKSRRTFFNIRKQLGIGNSSGKEVLNAL